MRLHTDDGQELYPGELGTTAALEYLGWDNPGAGDVLSKCGIPFRKLHPESKKSARLYKKKDLEILKLRPKWFNKSVQRRLRQEAAIQRLHKEGASIKEISIQVGLSISSVELKTKKWQQT